MLKNIGSNFKIFGNTEEKVSKAILPNRNKIDISQKPISLHIPFFFKNLKKSRLTLNFVPEPRRNHLELNLKSIF